MALSGSTTAGGTAPKLRIDWSATQSIPNNTSSVTAIVYLVATYNVNFSTTKSGSITVNGNKKNFSTSKRFSGTGTWELARHTVTVGHNGDGTKSFSFSASYGINITYSGSYLGTISHSGSGALTTIPRASSISSISGGEVGKTLTVNISRASDSFTHSVWYRKTDGTEIFVQGGVGTSMSFTIPKSDANLMPSATSGQARIWVRTYSSGGTRIGDTHTFFNVTIPDTAEFTPNMTVPTASIHGTGRDKTINKYVQGISRVDMSATASGVYGSTIVSRTIEVKQTSGGGDASGGGGLSRTSSVITGSGSYTVYAWARDSRGRTITTTSDITVEAYNPPKITSFTANRATSATDVSINTKVTHTIIGTNNPLALKVQRKARGGAWEDVRNLTDLNASVNDSFTSTGNAETSSYEFLVTVTDSFGMEASSIASVSTSAVALSINKDTGIGVGKVWERGALDVGGKSYFSDTVRFNGGIESNYISRGTDLDTLVNPGFYHSPTNADASTMLNKVNASAFSLLVENHAGIKQTWTSFHNDNIVIYVRNSYLGVWGDWVCITGEYKSNSNGSYTKLPDGTLICSTTATLPPVNVAWGSLYYAYMTPINWTFPHEFVSMPSVEASFRESSFWLVTTRVSNTSVNGLSAARPTTTSNAVDVKLTATGRWK